MDEVTHRRTGGCFCGEIKYQVVGEPIRVARCYCKECQKFTGSDFSVYAIFWANGLTWAARSPKWFNSGYHGQKGFCPDCGMTLVCLERNLTLVCPERKLMGVYLNTLDDRDGLTPDCCLWISQKLPQTQIPDNVAVFDRFYCPTQFTRQQLERFDDCRPQIRHLQYAERLKVQGQIAHYVRSILPPPADYGQPDNRSLFKLNPSDVARLASQFDAEGILDFGKVILDHQIQEIRDYFLPKPVYGGHLIAISDGVPRSLDNPAVRKQRNACYHPCDVMDSPHLLEIANDPMLLKLVESYLGCVPTIYSINVWWSFALQSSTGTGYGQAVHRDNDDYKFCTVFIYLSDLEDGDGAHMYFPKSHREDTLSETIKNDDRFRSWSPSKKSALIGQLFDSKSDGYDLKEIIDNSFGRDCWRKLSGCAGNVMLESTFGLHFGAVPVSRDRLCAWIRYGMGLEYERNYFDFKTEKEFPQGFDRILKTDTHSYINRNLALQYARDQKQFPESITSSSSLGPELGPEAVLGEQPPIWHAQTPPIYPEWVMIKYSRPMVITGLGIRSQSSSPGGIEYKRAPKDFIFQGGRDLETWRDLLTVKDNRYAEGGAWKNWSFENEEAFSYFRIFITASDDPVLLTIAQVTLT